MRHIKDVGSRKNTSSVLFSISFLMAPQLCWPFQLLHNELVISEKCCFIHITARYSTGIPPVSSILLVPAMTCFWGVTSQFFRHQGKKDIRNGPSHTNVRAQGGRLKESLCFDLLRDWLIGMSSSGQMQVYNMYLSKCHRTVHSGSFWSSQNTKTREIWLFYVHTHLPYTPQKASNSQLWNFYPIFLASIVQARLCQENTKQVRKCMHKTFTERHYSWRQNQLFDKPSQHLQRHENTTLARAKLSSANPQQLNTIFHQKMAQQKDRRGDMLC